MRNAFLTTLMECAEADSAICLVVGDLGYSVVEPFRDRFTSRFLNAGIAEQNMTGLAAGMAMTGKKVFTYSIANFPTLRCLEQIRNDVCYHGANVTIVAVGGGIGYGSLGYSHHAVQDIACLRGFPGILMATPGDPLEVIAVTRYLCLNYNGPCYLRLGKGGELAVGQPISVITPGIRVITERSDKAILACGGVLGWVAPIAESHQCTLASVPMWWPDSRFRTGMVDFVRRHHRIVVVEEHLSAGGFGSFVREQLEDHPELQSRIRCLALDERSCGAVGSPAFIRGASCLDADAVGRALTTC